MFGQLFDVIAFDPHGDMGSCTYYYDVPKGYIHNGLIPPSHYTIQITFEYGPTHPDCPNAPDGVQCTSYAGREIFRIGRTPFADNNPGASFNGQLDTKFSITIAIIMHVPVPKDQILFVNVLLCSGSTCIINMIVHP
jgi:hypothetical protein